MSDIKESFIDRYRTLREENIVEISRGLSNRYISDAEKDYERLDKKELEQGLSPKEDRKMEKRKQGIRLAKAKTRTRVPAKD